ncbi:ABC transporter transmembrane domain-containing protein [Prochlorococcus marinus]|uniref:ABC transporter transmembrane domain-containing protein n=1 Tax=Prochlorococcus marinus TaxID=1219 RepID=UPI0022B41477|nr:ABC transporter transmembrane domain-containing protein [Prochlorococcus marinus]
MENNFELNLKDIKAFQNLSTQGLEKIKKKSRFIKYNLGQIISQNFIIPNSINLIITGEARLLSKKDSKTETVTKLGQGLFTGLGSFLNVKACEEITASSELQCLALEDELILDLYLSEPSFYKWCNSNAQPGEIQLLAENLITKSTRNDINLKAAFQQLINNSKIKIVENNNDLILNKDLTTIVSSNNVIDNNVGDIIEDNSKIKTKGPLPARFIEIPKNLFKAFISTPQNTAGIETKEISSLKNNNLENAPLLPEVSGTDIGQIYQEENFEIITAEGSLKETQACLEMLAREMDLPFRKDAVEKVLRDTIRGGEQPTLQICGSIAAILGLHATGAKIPRQFANRLQTPSIITWKESFALVINSNAKFLTIASPKEGLLKISSTEFESKLPDFLEVLLVEKTYMTPEKKFGIDWFWPALKKHKNVLIQVLLASFVVQLFGLANPLLIQVIIDKVISQRSLDTLQILGFALVIVTILGGILGSLRTFLFTETTNRIDTRLGAEVIDHLLRLPLKYYDKRPVGELASRISELEKIRNFLTGQALTTLLDACFSLIYILVMVIYSWLLTLIALGVVPLQILLTLIGTPLIRRQIRDVAQENAKTQSHLIEVLTGIQTVKAQNVETVSRWKWQDLYNKYIARTFEKTITGTALNETSNVLQQLSQLLVLWVGATLVLNGQLTLGQLIAFRIISGYVTQPILRLSSIWQNIQELRVSFERLADIVDTQEESSEADKSNIPLSSIKGHVRFHDICFGFNQNDQVLNTINLEISPGKFIGIAGQSGSGKSTLMKLLPRLYQPQKGKILIDDLDISKVELYSLRRQIGIVPQDPLLFSGTISDNIALTNPNVSSEEIVEAAKIAGAHEFIMELPMGYSSNVGERGAGLSGGQRQRIAIARTILSKPKLLIMDEATSALDYDTERKVCENIKRASKGTTCFFITHRLNTIRNADMIVLLHKGVLDEKGTHQELMENKGRYYALFRQQESSE